MKIAIAVTGALEIVVALLAEDTDALAVEDFGARYSSASAGGSEAVAVDSEGRFCGGVMHVLPGPRAGAKRDVFERQKIKARNAVRSGPLNDTTIRRVTSTGSRAKRR